MFIVLLLCFLVSCKNSNESLQEINTLFNYKLSNFKDVQVEKIYLNNDYLTPYNIFIKYNCSKSAFIKMMENAKMINDTLPNKLDLLCINSKVSILYYEKYFDLHTTMASSPIKNFPTWWQPSTKKQDMTTAMVYAGNYNIKKGIIQCGQKDKKDGRVVAHFINGVVYTLIEVYWH